MAQVIGQVGANPERHLAAACKTQGQFNGFGNGQTIREHQGLGTRIGTVGLIVRQQALAPDEGIARVVTGTVKQLAEVHVKVTQKGIHAINIRQGNAQITAIFFGPHFQSKNLRITQTRAQGLTSLQVFVTHGAQGRHPILHGQPDVAGARKVRLHLLDHGGDHFFVPLLGKAAARAVIRHAKVTQGRIIDHQTHFGLQTLTPFCPRGLWTFVAKVNLVHNGQHRNLEQNRVQPGALNRNFDLARHIPGLHLNAALGQMEQPQKIDKVAFDKAQAAKIIQLGV